MRGRCIRCISRTTRARRTVPRKARQSGDFDSLRILTTIYIPLAKPALLTITVFTFIATWNDLWGPLLYLYDEKLYALPLDLMKFIGVAGNAQGTRCNW